jgi:hypothetical protein
MHYAYAMLIPLLFCIAYEFLDCISIRGRIRPPSWLIEGILYGVPEWPREALEITILKGEFVGSNHQWLPGVQKDLKTSTCPEILLWLG